MRSKAGLPHGATLLLLALSVSTVVSQLRPSVSSVCRLPKVVGPCEALIPRYYYSIKTGRCERFNYGGCQGNANNFPNKAACERRCPPRISVGVCRLPKVIGPCYAAIPRYFFNSRRGRCERFIYGGCQGNGNNFQTRAQCQRTCPPRISTNVCKLQKVIGPCRAAFRRFFFNYRTGRCERFIYGGCRGNANNFQTRQECEARCPPRISQGVCDLPKVTGPCLAAFRRYFFNKNTGRCELFIFGGCRGNANNFRSLADCEAKCPANSTPSKLICTLPKVIGRCRAAFPRYFYDVKSKTCRPFTYGGCGGNANNFKTLQLCKQSCP